MNGVKKEQLDMRAIKAIIINILYIIIIPIIVYDLILIVQAERNPEVTPSAFGIKTFTIISGSMSPVINIDDIIIVEECSKSDLELNDIITFKIDNEIITHRIINIQNVDGRLVYITKGDRNEVSDTEKIEFGQIEGKYLFRIPKLGKLSNWLKNKVVFGFILTFLCMGYIMQRILLYRKVDRKERRKEKRIKFEESKKNKDKKEI